MSDVKWIKITTDIFDDEKMLLIESLPDAHAIIVVWFKLLCLAGKMNNSGVFMMNDRIAYTDKMLSTIFRMKEATVQMALDTFQQFGMIDIINGVITIPNWGKHQSLDQIESKREYMRNYMSQYREKQKQISCKTYCKTNSKSNVSQADKELDKELDKEEDKDNIYAKNPMLNNAIKAYIEYRKNRNKPMNDVSIKFTIEKLNEMSSSDDEKIKIIYQSIDHGWTGLYPLKNNAGGKLSMKQNYDIDSIEKEFMANSGGE